MIRTLIGLSFYALVVVILFFKLHVPDSRVAPHDDHQRKALAGDPVSQLYLADYWQDQDQAIAAFWLQKLVDDYSDAYAWRLAKLRWSLGDIDGFEVQLSKALAHNTAEAMQFALQRRQVNLGLNAAQCEQTIHFVAQSPQGVRQLASFLSRWRASDVAAMPICFKGLTLLTPQHLACESTPRLRCNEANLAAQLTDQDFSHLVVMAKQGKANVINGIMYLDEQDTFDVFVHEMAHFAGMIDEYPLPPGQAKYWCLPGTEQANLKVTEKLANPPAQGWSKSKTCLHSDAQAWKPTQGYSFMQFYDEGDLDATYLDLWREGIQSGSRPAAYNFATQAEDNEIRHYWQQKLAAYSQ